jgi:hypothetical protein
MATSPTQTFESLREAKVVVPQHVVHRAFPTETVLLNLQTGQYHGLNPTAGRMFETLEETGDPWETVTRLANEFDLPVEVVQRDLGEFCDGLLGRGLLELAQA